MEVRDEVADFHGNERFSPGVVSVGTPDFTRSFNINRHSSASGEQWGIDCMGRSITVFNGFTALFIDDDVGGNRMPR